MAKDLWITASVAAKLLEEKLGRPVRIDYITKLAQANRIRKRDMGSRIVLYHRHDIEQVQIRERKKPSGKLKSAPIEEMPTIATDQQEDTQISIIERFEDLPIGSMKRAEFAKQHKLHNSELGQWLEYGLKGESLPVSYYNYHGDKAAAFTPQQREQVLKILKKHGKLK